MKTYQELRNKMILKARYELVAGIEQCTSDQQLRFKQMYSKGNLDLSVTKVVDLLSERKLSWAMHQVQQTLDEN